MKRIVDFDPTKGQAYQGDVSIIPIPADIAIRLIDEVCPTAGRLILQEGEVSGHHHAIDVMDRPAAPSTKRFKAADAVMKDALAHKIALPSAKLYRDPQVAEEMRKRGILTRVDLVVGVLCVATGPMCLDHDEHDSIRLPVGNYIIGRQVESAGAEERRVCD